MATITINGKQIDDRSREYYATRAAYLPTPGEILENHGGFSVEVLAADVNGWHDGRAYAVVMNTRSGWVCEAHGIGQYADGRIDWDGSLGIGFLSCLGDVVSRKKGVLSFSPKKPRRVTARVLEMFGRDDERRVITCEVSRTKPGSRSGRKLWRDVESGEEYELFRGGYSGDVCFIRYNGWR